MHCKKCGKELAHGVRFCKYCGVAIQPEQIVVNQEQKIPKFTIPVLIGIAILAVVVGLFMRWNNANRPSAEFLRQLDGILSDDNDTTEINISDVEKLARQLEDSILKNVSYEVLVQEKDMVKLRISAPNMAAIISNSGQTILSQPNAIQSIRSTLESGSFEFIEIDLEVEITADGSPKDPYTLMNALYGNMFSQMTELLENIMAKGA